MNNETPNPLDAIDTRGLLDSFDLNWLILTPFPAAAVLFGIAAGLIIMALGWRQPESRRTYNLIGLGIIALSLLFWVFLIGVILWMLRDRRSPGWQRRRR
ncbi:MAG: hypothetical protein EA370_16215 [Wenzhouxiangella sp.]|nr:MAG: hypothetical protein EA370_16215 [Wenzhouxiangella sp.]